MAAPFPPIDLPADLVSGWRAIVGDAPGAERAMADLAHRYAEPHRRYHGVDHLIHVVRRASALIEADATVPPHEADAIVLAAWFHDAIYDPRAANNERRSADLATEALTPMSVPEAQCPEARCTAVERLVMATRDHRPAQRDEAILLDADLAVLGAPADIYDDYFRGVRAEYAHVSEADWRIGRAQVLTHFLARPVFTTAEAARDNGQANANLARELATLNG